MDDVVLQIQAALGVANQLGPSGEGLGAVRQQPKARAPFMGSGLGLDRAAERGLGGRQGLGGLTGDIKTGAAAQQ